MDKFTEYANLQRQIKALEAQANAMKAEILSSMPDKRYTAADGSQFTISYRKKWHYTNAVIDAEEMLKGMKKAEEKTGAATFEESPVLSVKVS